MRRLACQQGGQCGGVDGAGLGAELGQQAVDGGEQLFRGGGRPVDAGAVEPPEELGHGDALGGVQGRRGYLGQRFEHEAAPGHGGMGQAEVGLADHDAIEHEQVDVDGAVGIASVAALRRAAQKALYLLRGTQQLARRELRLVGRGGVEKLVRRNKAHGLRFVKRRAPDATAQPSVECFKGLAQRCGAAACVGAQTDVEQGHDVSRQGA